MEIPIELQEIIDPNKECCCAYHFSNKCKEWAFNNHDFILQSAYIPKGTFTSAYCIAQNNFSYPKYDQTFHADTEYEAVLKACQFILEQQK